MNLLWGNLFRFTLFGKLYAWKIARLKVFRCFHIGHIFTELPSRCIASVRCRFSRQNFPIKCHKSSSKCRQIRRVKIPKKFSRPPNQFANLTKIRKIPFPQNRKNTAAPHSVSPRTDLTTRFAGMVCASRNALPQCERRDMLQVGVIELFGRGEKALDESHSQSDSVQFIRIQRERNGTSVILS